jgi:chitodextrinase
VATTNASLVRDRVDGGAWSEPAPGPTVALALTPGPHTVEFQSVDAAGAVDPTPASSRVTVDLSPPRVRLLTRSDGARTVLRASAVDALTGVDPSSFRWTFGDGSTATGPLVRRRFGAARAGRVRLTVMDMAGNVGTFDTIIPAPVPAARDASPQADHGSRQFAERRSGGSRRRGRPAKRGHRSHRGFQA